MLAVLWIVAASLGRLATVRGLLDYFRRDLPADDAGGVLQNDGEKERYTKRSANHAPLPALLRLNFLRAAVALAASTRICGDVNPGRIRFSRHQSSTRARFPGLSAAGRTRLLGVVAAELAVVAGRHVCRPGRRECDWRDLRGRHFLPRTHGGRFRRQHMDRNGASDRFCRRQRGRFNGTRLCRSCTVAVGCRGYGFRDAGIFRRIRLAVHVAASRICVHRGNAGSPPCSAAAGSSARIAAGHSAAATNHN